MQRRCSCNKILLTHCYEIMRESMDADKAVNTNKQFLEEVKRAIQ